MITKSGTNSFHGDGYYFLRDSNFNANSWAANRAGSPTPYYHRDQLGGVIGGPIKKNKTFFFTTFEWTHSKSPSSATATVPTLDQRNGDFSKTFFSDGKLITIYNPFDTYKDASGHHETQSVPRQYHSAGHYGPGGPQGASVLPQAEPGP
jgi:hypothetical protein